jgi:hypothetical protein
MPNSHGYVHIIMKPTSFLSVPFTLCGAYGIHEELPSIAVFSYPLDLIP